MSIIIDIIILAFFILGIVISAKRGFVGTVAEVVGFVLAFIIAFNLGGTLADITYDKVIEPPVVSAVTEKATDDVAGAIDTAWDALPDIITKNGEAFGISKNTLTEKLSGSAGVTEQSVTDLSQTVIKPVAVPLFSSLYSIILFVLLLIAVGFISKLLNKIFSFSIIGKLNRTLGAVIGIPKGIIYAYLFCLVLTVVFYFVPDGIWIFSRENADNSYLFSRLMSFAPFK